jgi:hypothetical protein
MMTSILSYFQLSNAKKKAGLEATNEFIIVEFRMNKREIKTLFNLFEIC